MSPSPRNVFFRQQFDGPFDTHSNSPSEKSVLSKHAIIAITVGVACLILLAIALVIFLRLRRARRGKSPHHPLVATSTAATGGISLIPHPSPQPQGPSPGGKEHAYGGSAGYQAAQDQGQSLLGHADLPAIVAWDADAVGSTQDGYGYHSHNHSHSHSHSSSIGSINDPTAAGLQRPTSIASFTAPPPRYEVTAPGRHQRLGSEGGLRPLLLGQGEAASYYSADGGREPERERERGRSATREAPAAQRVSADSRRSLSRFREEGIRSDGT